MYHNVSVDSDKSRFLAATTLSVLVHLLLAGLVSRIDRPLFRKPPPELVVTVHMNLSELHREKRPKPPAVERNVSGLPAPTTPGSKPAFPPAVSPAARETPGPVPGRQSPVSVPSPPVPLPGDGRRQPVPSHPASAPQHPAIAPAAAERVERHPAPAGAGPPASYLAQVRSMIEERKEYPATARRSRREGVVTVMCVLKRSGEVRDVVVTGSSGSGLLDAAAEKAIRSVGQFPPCPEEVKGETFTFTVPLRFRLSGQ